MIKKVAMEYNRIHKIDNFFLHYSEEIVKHQNDKYIDLAYLTVIGSYWNEK